MMSDVLQAFAGETATTVSVTSRPASVLHVFKYFRPDFTGDGRYFEKLFPLLERAGVRNEVIAGVTRAAPGVTPPPGVRLFGRGSNLYLNPFMLFWFVVNAWRFDVVHLHCAVDRMFIYHMVARLSGCRIVQSCTLDDGLGSLVEGYRPRYRALVRRLCGLIDDVVTISPSLHADTVKLSPRSRVHLIPQGVAIPHPGGAAAREAMRAGMGVGAADTLLLFVGGICPRKDVGFLVANHPAERGDVHLLVVGPVLDGAYWAGLRQAIAESPAAGRIHVTGYMEDPSPAYWSADAFVFASHMEGCPNVVLEAMAHGLPIVARRLPGTTDSVVEHGRTGILFDTAEQYEVAVRRLVAEPEARKAMGVRALATICSTYEMDAVAARYAALYRRGD